MEAKAYNLYNRRVYPVQSVNKQNEERQVGKQKASRVVIGMVWAFCEVQSMCGMVIVECASWGNQCEGYWMIINTLRRGSNSKGLYCRYRSERSRNELGGWCNTFLNLHLRHSGKNTTETRSKAEWTQSGASKTRRQRFTTRNHRSWSENTDRRAS